MTALAVIFDLETCTKPPEPNDFVQLSSVMYVDGDMSTTSVFNALAKPCLPINPGAMAVHGISEEDVANKRPSRETAQAWLQLIKDFAAQHEAEDIYLIGHNIVRFDVPIVDQHIDQWPAVKMIDTLWAARRIDPISSNHQLSYLVGQRYALNTDLPKQAHDGLADCWMVGLLLQHYLKHTGKTLAEFCDWLSQPQLLELVPFGKSKGMPFSRLRPGSLRWFLGQDMDPDVRFTAMHWLRAHG